MDEADHERMIEIMKYLVMEISNPFMILSAFHHGVKMFVMEYNDPEMIQIDNELETMWERWIADLCDSAKEAQP